VVFGRDAARDANDKGSIEGAALLVPPLPFGLFSLHQSTLGIAQSQVELSGGKEGGKRMIGTGDGASKTYYRPGLKSLPATIFCIAKHLLRGPGVGLILVRNP
jgi:hypothetical protein